MNERMTRPARWQPILGHKQTMSVSAVGVMDLSRFPGAIDVKDFAVRSEF